MPVTSSNYPHRVRYRLESRKTTMHINLGLIYLALCVTGMLLLSGCPPDSPLPPGPERGLHIEEMDSIWVVGSSHLHTISISVIPVEHSTGREMICQIQGDGVSTHFRLYDDGGQGNWQDAVGFADSVSGDSYAEDGIFCRQVSSLFTEHTGEYLFKFALEGGAPPDSLAWTVILRDPETLEIVEIDTMMVLASDRMHRIEVRVIPMQLGRGREMICLIDRGLAVAEFKLYDDGGYGRWNDAAEFADSISGDHQQDNGVFTRRINSLFADAEGNYRFTFTLSGDRRPDSQQQVIYILFRNSTPQISSIEYPDSIGSGMNDIPFSAVVIDSNGRNDLVSVNLVLREIESQPLPSKEFSMTMMDDSTWAWLSEPSITAQIPTGICFFNIQAADRLLSQTNEFVESNPFEVWLENLPPAVIEVAGPDTVMLPDEGEKDFDYVISIMDNQGVTDLDSLLLELSDPIGVLLDSLYLDNGAGFDSVAGDGRYHAPFTVTADKTPYILYTFAWIPTDRSPQRGETFYSTLVFVPYESIQGRDERDNEFNRSKSLRLYPRIK